MQFNDPARNIVERIGQKLGEWIIAAQLERMYTKEEIIALYLNEFDFLYQAVGINSAARVYFNKKPIDLQLEEAAVLVAMAKILRCTTHVATLSAQSNAVTKSLSRWLKMACLP